MGALIFAIVHLFFPKLTVDAITIFLIVIAIVPWLAPVIKSVELPGGLKIELQDLQKKASRAETAGLLSASPSKEEVSFAFQSIATHDPNLALAGLRIEIEKRLLSLAESYSLRNDRAMGVGQLLRKLTQADVLTNEERSILADMVNTLNSAVHGATVDPRVARWAIEIGPRLLASLDERINEAREKK